MSELNSQQHYLGNLDTSSPTASPTRKPKTPKAKRFAFRPGRVVEETTGSAISVISFERDAKVRRPSVKPVRLEEPFDPNKFQRISVELDPVERPIAPPSSQSTPAPTKTSLQTKPSPSQPSLAPLRSQTERISNKQRQSIRESDPRGFAEFEDLQLTLAETSTASPSTEEDSKTQAAEIGLPSGPETTATPEPSADSIPEQSSEPPIPSEVEDEPLGFPESTRDSVVGDKSSEETAAETSVSTPVPESVPEVSSAADSTEDLVEETDQSQTQTAVTSEEAELETKPAEQANEIPVTHEQEQPVKDEQDPANKEEGNDQEEDDVNDQGEDDVNRPEHIPMADVLQEEILSKEGDVELRVSSGGLFGRKKFATRRMAVEGSLLTFCKPTSKKPELRAKLDKNCHVDLNGAEFTVATAQRNYTCKAGSSTEAKEWVEVLRSACKRTSKQFRNRKTHEVVIAKEPGVPLGIRIAGGIDSNVKDKTDIYVTDIKPDGAAAKQGVLQKGDVLVEIDGKTLQGIAHDDATKLLRQASGNINIKVLRKVKRTGSSNTSLAASPTLASKSPSNGSKSSPLSSPQPSSEALVAANGITSECKPLEPVSEDGTPKLEETPVKAPPPAASTDANETGGLSREERLRRMSERRKNRRQEQKDDVLSALKMIDDLPEE
eukprot:TRINITY_DN10173_c0_g2_i1.p2 TRINITY_DN10173_c0_g2~~TRINITY_DN10173_c0_g2_i1.p2  ORF type:complete len:665 (+),score=186.11 TRINITY_DN10173_c0_g2_i1:2684-4678(+)